jgi:ADP-ribose pyrophosphatase YjhB (NUDIX family)
LVGSDGEPGETAALALVRECREAPGVEPTRVKPAGTGHGGRSVLSFHFFCLTNWTGGAPRKLGDEKLRGHEIKGT